MSNRKWLILAATGVGVFLLWKTLGWIGIAVLAGLWLKFGWTGD